MALKLNLASFGAGLTNSVAEGMKKEKERKDSMTDSLALYTRKKGIDRYHELKRRQDILGSDAAAATKRELLELTDGNEAVAKNLLDAWAGMDPSDQGKFMYDTRRQITSAKAPEHRMYKFVDQNGNPQAYVIDMKKADTEIPKMMQNAQKNGWSWGEPDDPITAFKKDFFQMSQPSSTSSAEKDMPEMNKGTTTKAPEAAPVPSSEQTSQADIPDYIPASVRGLYDKDPELYNRYKKVLDNAPDELRNMLATKQPQEAYTLMDKIIEKAKAHAAARKE